MTKEKPVALHSGPQVFSLKKYLINLLVHLEAVPAVLEVGNHLVGSGKTGVDVSLGGLGTHLLGGEQYSLGILGLELVAVGGLHVSHIAEVGTCLHGLGQTCLVDDLLAGSVDEHTVLGQHLDEALAN